MTTIKEIHKGDLPGEKRWRITVVDTKTNRVLYDQLSHAGALSSVESVESEGGGVLNGNCQTVFWGHPIKWLFAMDQLRQTFQKNRKKILADILPDLKSLGLSEKEEKVIRSMFDDFAHKMN